jgi:hypothetical protein
VCCAASACACSSSSSSSTSLGPPAKSGCAGVRGWGGVGWGWRPEVGAGGGWAGGWRHAAAAAKQQQQQEQQQAQGPPREKRRWLRREQGGSREGGRGRPNPPACIAAASSSLGSALTASLKSCSRRWRYWLAAAPSWKASRRTHAQSSEPRLPSPSVCGPRPGRRRRQAQRQGSAVRGFAQRPAGRRAPGGEPLGWCRVAARPLSCRVA